MFLIKPLSSLFGVFILLFVGWIFLAGMPTERIDRGCRPIGWFGNVMTSIFAIGAPSLSQASFRAFSNIEYGCQYAIWRLIYEKEWVEQQQTVAQKSRLTSPDAVDAANPGADKTSSPTATPTKENR